MAKELISTFVMGLRAGDNMTTQEFADKYHISKTNVSRLEKGHFDNPSRLIAARFCNTFGFTLDEFRTRFIYDNKKIDSSFKIIDQIQKRARLEFSDDFSIKIAKQFYDNYGKKIGLYGYSKIDDSEEYKTSQVYVPHSAECYFDKKKIWIGAYLSAVDFDNRPMNYNYATLDHAISNIATYDAEEVGCDNFIIIVDKEKMYDFFINRAYKKNTSTVYITYMDGKGNFNKPKLLFGKGLLK